MRKARTRRRWNLSSTLAVLALGLFLTACSNAPQSALDPQGPYAQKPDDLFKIVFAIAVVVFIVVQSLIIFTAVKFRAKKGDESLPVQVHGNTKLEIFWTLVPALILAGLAVPTVQMIFELDAEPEGAMTVEVIGHRWWWEYRYPGEDVITANELVIPAGRPIRLQMTAEESGTAERGVIHSFWIPPLGGKQDVVPGRTTTLNIQADEPGRYLGQCAEYCGLSHANMRARVVALSESDFAAWLENQQQDAVVPEPGTLAAKGAELFAQEGGNRRSCVACHAIKGNGPQGIVGPNLTHFMSREEFAGAIFDIDEENLSKWLKNAPAMKPMQPETGIGMPNLGLTDEEVEALVAYLMTLE